MRIACRSHVCTPNSTVGAASITRRHRGSLPQREGRQPFLLGLKHLLRRQDRRAVVEPQLGRLREQPKGELRALRLRSELRDSQPSTG